MSFKKNKLNNEIDEDSFKYKMLTAIDYMQMALQEFFTVIPVLIIAFLVGDYEDIKKISEDNDCSISEATAIWISQKMNDQK